MITGTIRVIERHSYGKARLYPNCEASKVFSKLIGRKTFQPWELDTLKWVGVTVLIEQETNPVQPSQP